MLSLQVAQFDVRSKMTAGQRSLLHETKQKISKKIKETDEHEKSEKKVDGHERCVSCVSA